VTARIARHLRAEAHKDGAYLVPLRVFIGIGWLRAFAEKAIEPGWRDGTSLTAFLTDRLREGRVALPPYESLVTAVFLPNATALGWIVMVGQLLAGLAILTGCTTRAALVGGLFMNLNFLLAGQPDPSAFYIVIQIALLLANTGAILGLDEHLPQPVRPCRRSGPRAWAWPGTVFLMALGVAAYALSCAKEWGPAGSVHDPAMILAILAFMTAGWSAFAYLRVDPGRRDSERPKESSEQGVSLGLAVRQTTSPT
jgi:thiosulfate dehydrogenase [quinone] large subunit